jgi:peptidoglycan/xylan/chitin deacetylase (PgdA/CDA1 family)
MKFLPMFALALTASAVCQAQSAQTPAHARTDSMYVPILVYHGVFPHHPGQTRDQIEYDVAPENFEKQMAYLRDSGFRVISLSSYVDALRKGDTVPRKSVVITLDDGPTNQYVHAFPVLRKFGYTATFFIYPNPMENSHENFMTWAQVRELQAAGMTIGSHTYTHPRLTDSVYKHNMKDLNLEIAKSRAVLEKRLNTTVDLIAFPFGLHTPVSDSAIKAAGYRSARGFPGGGWNSAATVYALRAFEITDNMAAFRRDLRPSPPKPAAANARGKTPAR